MFKRQKTPLVIGPARRNWLCSLGLVCSLVLSACGGGTNSVATDLAEPVISTGSVEGLVVVSDDSSLLLNAKVSTTTVSTLTTVDGKFTLSKVPAAARVVLRIEAAGFVDGLVTVPVVAGQTVRASARLVRAAAAVNIDPTAAAVVTSGASVAQVALSANTLVNAVTGAAASGSVTARVTPINPAADPRTMPGDYTVSDTVRIESFGAIKVSLQDASGAQLNLKSGSSAIIRIPLASRSVTPPATIPLYYFNETTGRWVKEGSATLSGTAPNQYYEGTVAHFTYWNADQEQDTIFVNGCVNNSAGAPFADALVQTVGLDYSGSANASSSSAGTFRVAIRKGGRAYLSAESGSTSNTVIVGPSDTDINLSTCLVMSAVPLAPAIIEQPASQTVASGWPVSFSVAATGSRPLKYQWRRNGVNIPGATFDWLSLVSNRAADNGVMYTVVVSNASGSVTSAPASVTVSPDVAPVMQLQPSSISVSVGQSATFLASASGSPTPTYQWKRNGIAIAGATASSYATAALDLSDSGALFSVVASNSQGAVTSDAVSVTVTAAISASTEEKFKLMRLLSLSFDFVEAATLPGQMITDDGVSFINVASLCKTGSFTGSFNGASVPAAGTPVPGRGTLAATASACVVHDISYTGSSAFGYEIIQGNPKTLRTIFTINNMRIITSPGPGGGAARDFTANGNGSSEFVQTVVGLDTTNVSAWTPAAGASLRNELSGLSAIFNSGSVSVLTVSRPAAPPLLQNTTRVRASYNNLLFAISGINYLANGYYELNFASAPGLAFSGSGEIILSANGIRIGRIYASNSGVFVEADGVVQAF